MFKIEKRIYISADGKRLIEKGKESGASLAEGSEIPNEQAITLGLKASAPSEDKEAGETAEDKGKGKSKRKPAEGSEDK